MRIGIFYNDEELLKDVLTEDTWEEKEFDLLSESKKEDLKNKVIMQDLRQIKERFFKSDLKIIANTRGDVTRVQNYKDLREVIKILRQSLNEKEYQKDLAKIEVALDNLESNKNMIMKSIGSDNDIMLTLYTTTTASAIMATSIILKNAIEDAKETRKVFGLFNKLNRKSSPKLFMKNIDQFNTIVSSGRLKKLALTDMESEQLMGTVVTVAKFGSLVSVIGLGSIFIIKEVIYYFYYFKNSLSGYLQNLSDFLELNANTSNNDPKSAKKQRDIASKLANMADRLNTDDKITSRKAAQEVDNDKDNYPSIQSDAPSNSSGPVFL